MAVTAEGDGLRDSSNAGLTNTIYTWDVAAGMPVLLQDRTSPATGANYVHGPSGILYRLSWTGSQTYYLADGLGSVMKSIDANGNTLGTATYDVYGANRTQTGNAFTFNFAGEQTDATGLQYLRARYYDPATGTFMSRDPLTHAPGYAGSPQGYAGANPVMNTDPSGLMVPLEEEWVGDHYDQSDGPNYAGCGGCQDGELETDPSPDPQLAPPQAGEDPVDDIREMPHGGTNSSDDVASSADKPRSTTSEIAAYLDDLSLGVWAFTPITGGAIAGVGCASGFGCAPAAAVAVAAMALELRLAGGIGVAAAAFHCVAGEVAECGIGFGTGFVGVVVGTYAPGEYASWAVDGALTGIGAIANWALH